jgi:hypothetical protein
MATRRPIVLVSGISSELPVGDVIDTGLDVTLQPNPSGLYFTGDNKLGFDGQGDNIQVIASGVGAVYRTVQDKGRDIVSVKDFGAVGDGVVDDTAAIQAALNAHFGVFFPAGNYRLNGSLTLREGNSLQGPSNSNSNTDTSLNNGSVKLIFYGVGDACFKSASTAGIGRLGFSGITIMAHDNPGRPWVFDFPALNESNFFCVAATNADATGGVLYVSPGTASVSAWINYFTNCEFGVADACTQYTVDATFTDTRIVGCYFTGGKGFYYHGFGGVLFSSCHFDRTNSAGAGLLLGKRTATHDPTQQTTVVGCYFDENDAAGIILDSSTSSVNTAWQTTVVGCAFRNRGTATDIKCLSAAGNNAFGGTFVGCSMTSGIPGFSFGARWSRQVLSGITVPGVNPFIYQTLQVLPGLAAETGGNPSLTWRNSGPNDGSPNTVQVGISGAALNGEAYINTGKGGVAASTPFVIRIDNVEKFRVAAPNGDIVLPDVSAPAFAPTTGGKLWVQSGALRYVGSSGTVTTIAPA